MEIQEKINNFTTKEILKLIEEGISNNEDISFFEPYYKALSARAAFFGTTIENDWFYRARISTNKLFEHVDELKYPPKQFALKGRLNDFSEQVAYMSIDEIGPMVELDVGYYQLFCMAKIKHLVKDTIFYYVGIKGKYESKSQEVIDVNTYYSKLMSTKGKNCYNATIALGRHFIGSKALDNNGKQYKTGIAYNSVQEDKSNKFLYNIAVYPQIFDECFRIEEAVYSILTYDPKQDAIVVYDVNKGIVNGDGRITWEKTFSEMIDELENKFSKDIFKLSNNSIIHYRYGGGTIISDNGKSYLVSFNNGEQVVYKKDIYAVNANN